MDINELTLLLGEKAGSEIQTESKKTNVRLKPRDLKLFCESLSRLLQGGIPMLRALEALEKSASKRGFKNFLVQVQEGVRQGSAFSETLKSTKAVPPFFSQIIYAGEVSGSIPTVLEELARYLEKEETLKHKTREALAYPCFILLMGLATLGVLLRVVIPKLAGVYKDFGADLPGITRLILIASDFYIPAASVLFVSACFALILFLRKKEILASLIYKTPVAGEFFRMCVLIQFSRLLSLLLESGISILEALEIIGKTFTSHFLKKDIALLREGLAEGRGFSKCLESVVWMDGLSKMLVSAGEESGRLASSFSQVARDTEINLESRIQMLVKLLEPGLILAIGIIVGIVVIGTVLPIFDISGLVR